MKILLTGPTGFIGSAFARRALARGHSVGGLIVPTESVPAGLAGTPMKWLRGTLEHAPWQDLAAFGADVCVHTAWITTPGVYLESPENERFRDTSLVFARRLWELGVNHVVGLGTCVEYASSNRPVVEDSSPSGPTTLYARCKNELRLALAEGARAHGRLFAWGRVFYPYGPGEHPSRLCSSIIQRLSSGQKVVLKTPESTKDYIYIEDLAAAVLRVVESRYSGLINLGTGTGTTVREIATRLGSQLGSPELVSVAEQPQPDPFPIVVADATRLKGLGWQPEWTLGKGLAELVRGRGPEARASGLS